MAQKNKKRKEKKIDTFNLAFDDGILKQSLAKSSVQYVFLSLLLQRMQGGLDKVTRMK